MPVYVEQGKIRGRFMSIIMNPMPALITTILDSLKYAVAAGNHLPCVLVLYTEQINMDQILNLHVVGDFLNYILKFVRIAVNKLQQTELNCQLWLLVHYREHLGFTLTFI